MGHAWFLTQGVLEQDLPRFTGCPIQEKGNWGLADPASSQAAHARVYPDFGARFGASQFRVFHDMTDL